MLVWLVDDDDGLRDTVAGILEEAGHEVVQFISLDYLQEGFFECLSSGAPLPSLIISDFTVKCGGQKLEDGAALAMSLRKAGSRTPFLLMSGQRWDEICATSGLAQPQIDASPETPVNAFLPKPIRSSDPLLAAVAQLTGQPVLFGPVGGGGSSGGGNRIYRSR